jgi:uncharacterized protein YfbU (UPF0304 family)
MTERFELRLDRDILDRVDDWRGGQKDLPSRAEAVRRLMEAGFGKSDAPRFSDGEKLITLMLCEVYKALGIKGEIDPEFVSSVLYGGHYWGLAWGYSGLFHVQEDDKRVVSEVVDILDMWSFIERGYAKLSKSDQQRVATEAGPFGTHVVFTGFDGNNEVEYMGIARFLIEKLKRFSTFAGRELNSHAPTVERYRRMYSVFEPMRQTLIGVELDASQLIKILAAR